MHAPATAAMERTHSPKIGTTTTKRTTRIRIVALDGIRGLLALHIVFGHFLRFAGPSKPWMQFFAQVNITVGAFFALSGYVSAYTYTCYNQVGGETDASFSLKKQWWMSKAMTFYPVHWCVLLVFGPMFVYSDVTAAPTVARGLATAIANGILSVTLTQAWLPMNHAEIWNAPTWFLSSLSFCNGVLAMALPRIAAGNNHKNSDNHKGRLRLRIALFWLYWINLVPVLVYLYFCSVRNNNSWGLVEGMTPPNQHPSLGLFNVLRFFPAFNAAETLMGAVACRIVMLDSSISMPRSEEDAVSEAATTDRITATTAVAVPFGITIGILVGRAVGSIPDCSDLFVRKFVFVPMFLNFVMALHRNAILVVLSDKSKSKAKSKTALRIDPISALLSTKLLVWLGTLSFPIYILHGPIGQLFYKRAIATKLWGGVLRGKEYFALYIASVILSAMLVQKMFSKRKNNGDGVIGVAIGVATKKIVKWFGY